MTTKIEKLENSRVKLTVQIEADVLEKAVEEAYRKNVGSITIPGFRKGKAPRQIIERTYGHNVFLEDAVDLLIPRNYQAVVAETKIRPVDQPDLEIEQIERGVGATFVYTVDVYPELEIGNYKGLKAEREITVITEQDVENVLKEQQQRNAELIVVDDRTTVAEGDYSVLDFIGFVDGQPFSGGAAENHTLEIGSGQFIPGFEEQLVGMEVGETKDVLVTFPSEYHAENLAGKEATFKVTIKELKVKSLPELDDEFAKDISKHETLDELKAEIRKNLEDEATRRTTAQLENTLLKLIAEDSQVEIPQSMIEHQAEHLVEHMMDNLRMSGISAEDYFRMTGQTEQEVQKNFEPNAKKQIINDLIIDKVQELEGISATEEEVDQKISEYLGSSDDMDPELEASMREYWNGQRDRIEMMLLREKTLQFIIDQADVTEVEAAQEELAEEQ